MKSRNFCVSAFTATILLSLHYSQNRVGHSHARFIGTRLNPPECRRFKGYFRNEFCFFIGIAVDPFQKLDRCKRKRLYCLFHSGPVVISAIEVVNNINNTIPKSVWASLDNRSTSSLHKVRARLGAPQFQLFRHLSEPSVNGRYYLSFWHRAHPSSHCRQIDRNPPPSFW